MRVHVRPASGHDPLDADDDAAPMAGSAKQPGKEVVIAGAVLTTSPASATALATSDSYRWDRQPGWSRIEVTPNMAAAEAGRGAHPAAGVAGLGGKQFPEQLRRQEIRIVPLRGGVQPMSMVVPVVAVLVMR
jgi:hypothetical protein